jgi:hypothetical protein
MARRDSTLLHCASKCCIVLYCLYVFVLTFSCLYLNIECGVTRWHGEDDRLSPCSQHSTFKLLPSSLPLTTPPHHHRSLFLGPEGSEQVVYSPSSGANTLPTIHHRDLLLLLEHLATCPEAFPSFFIPAVDFCAESLQRWGGGGGKIYPFVVCVVEQTGVCGVFRDTCFCAEQPLHVRGV